MADDVCAAEGDISDDVALTKPGSSTNLPALPPHPLARNPNHRIGVHRNKVEEEDHRPSRQKKKKLPGIQESCPAVVMHASLLG